MVLDGWPIQIDSEVGGTNTVINKLFLEHSPGSYYSLSLM